MERAAVPSMIREQRLNQWIEDYSDSILRTCFLYLSDQTQAEDATQDTWIKAWKHMDDFERKGIANEKAWLLRIAINTCKDYRRTAWFRHVDRSKALDELPPQLIAVEPEDRTLTLMVMDLPDRYKQQTGHSSPLLSGAYDAGNSRCTGCLTVNSASQAEKSGRTPERIADGRCD